MSSPACFRWYRLSGSGGSRALSRANPSAATFRCTRDFDRPRTSAMRAWVKRKRRRASTAFRHSGGSAVGMVRGRDERSRRPPAPSSRRRRVHLRTALRPTPRGEATTDSGTPLARRAAINPRLAGVVRANLWMFIRASSEVLWVFGDFQNTPRSADEQLLLFGDDLLGHHS